MKIKCLKMLFALHLIIAAIAIFVICTTYLNSPIIPSVLLERTMLEGMVFLWYLGISGAAVVLYRLRQWLASDQTGNIAQRHILPWYASIFGFVIGVAFLIASFSISHIDIRLDHGVWMVGGSKGHPAEIVSEVQAVSYLWKDLRAYAAGLLLIILAWLIFVSAGIEKEKTKPK